MTVNIMCTSGQVLAKAGSGVAQELVSGAAIAFLPGVVEEYIDEAEGDIMAMARNDYATSFASLDANKRKVLQGLASDLAAIDCVTYDMGGYTSRIEAEDIINVRRDAALRRLSIIRDKKAQDFVDK